MRAILAVVIAALLAAAVALWFQGLEGYLIAVLPPYRLQIAWPLVVVLAAVLVVVGYVGLRLIARLVATPRTVRQWRQRRHLARALAALEAGVAGWALGRPKASFQALDRCHRLGLGHIPAAVAAFEAAVLAGEEAQAENALARIPEEGQWASVKRVLTVRFALAFRRHELLTTALPALARDNAVAPSVRDRLLVTARAELGDWPQTLEAARALSRHRRLPAGEWQRVVAQAYPALVAAWAASGQPFDAWWVAQPKNDRHDPAVVAAVVRALIDQGYPNEAHALAAAFLAKGYVPEVLAALLPALPADAAWLDRLERWQAAGEDPVLLEALLRVAVGLRLVGKAKEYFTCLHLLDPQRARQVAADLLLTPTALAQLWQEEALPAPATAASGEAIAPTVPTVQPIAAEAATETDERAR